jgi:VCBS repeat-containing protein
MTTRLKKTKRHARLDRVRSLLDAASDWFARAVDPGVATSRSLDLLSLEDRVFFNAAPLGDALPDATEAVSEHVSDIINMLDLASLPDAVDFHLAPSVVESLEIPNADTPPDIAFEEETPISHDELPIVSDPPNDPSSATESHEIVFVDEAVEDYEALVRDLQQRDGTTTRYEVVLLRQNESGIASISATLSDRQDISGIHLVSHGSDSGVQLGSDWLSADNVDGYAWQIDQWRFALTDNADMLFYGCDLAGSESGRELLDSLAAACDCDVAASTDDTGHAIFGGDWDLEYATGDIETDVAFSEYMQENWGHLLNVTIDATSVDTTPKGDITDTFSHTTSGTDRLMLVGISFGSDKDESVASVTYNGTALQLVGTRDNADTMSARVEIWSLIAPDVGTHNLTINYSGNKHEGATIGVMTFNGVDQMVALGAFASNEGNSGSLTTTVASASGEIVFGVAALESNSDIDFVPEAGQTEQWDAFQEKANGAGSTEAGAASVVTSWTTPSTEKWAVGGVSIKETAPNVAPSLDLDANNSSGATGNDFQTTFTENLGPVLIVDGDATLTDPDSMTLASATIQITNIVDVTAEILTANTSSTAITANFNINTGTLTLAGIDTVAHYQQVLRTVQYNHTSENPTGGVRLVTFAVDDALDTVQGITTSVTVNAINDRPAIDGPDARTTLVDQPLVFLSSNGNSLTISDPDSGNSAIRVTIATTNGSFSLADTTGLSFTFGDGTLDSTMTFTGVLSDINNALAGSQYFAGSGYVGSAAVQLTAFDLGNSGSGGAKNDTHNVAITVTSASDLAAVPEFLVNTGQTVSSQATSNEDRGSSRAIATASDGSYVVVWTDNEGVDSDVNGQRYNRFGEPVGTSFAVNQTTSGHQRWASVDTDNNGNFVVTWVSENQDGTPRSVYARRFDADGMALGPEFRVNTSNSGTQDNSSVAVDANGDFVVVWEGDGAGGYDIYGRRFDSTGMALGNEFQISVSTPNGEPAVAIADDGRFVVVWDDSVGIRARLYAANGTPVTGEFLVHSETYAGESAVAMDANGNFVVVWRETNGGQDVFYRQFDSLGNPLAATKTLNTTTTGTQTNPSVAVDSAGNFIATWEGFGTGDTAGVFYRRFTSAGVALDAFEVRVNQTTAGTQNQASLAVQNVNNFAVVWSGNGPGDADGVFVRQFGTANRPPVNTVPGAQSINEDSVLNFEAANGNKLSINDTDAGSSLVQVTLSVTNGTVSLQSTTGLAFGIGDGNADPVQQFSGTLANINAALAQVKYVPTANFNGSAQLQILTDDLGNTGTGGPQVDVDTVAITVNAVNDAPVNTVPGSQSTNEDTSRIFSVANGNAISVSDIDAGSNSVEITLTASQGTLTLNGVSGLSFSSGDGIADATTKFTGTLANVNAALNGLVFAPTANFAGTAGITITTNDVGNSGAGGAHSDTSSVTITVNAVNDAPVAAGDPNYLIAEDATLAVNAAAGVLANDFDVDGPTLQAVLFNTTGNGSLTLNADGSFVYVPTTNFFGVDTFTYRATDGSLNSAVVTATITVSAVNDAPVAANDPNYAIAEDTTLNVNAALGVLANDSDVDGPTLQAVLVTTTTNGSLTLNANGSFVYVPTASFFGTDTFTYEASDGSLPSTVATATITVSSINDAPVAVGDPDYVIVEDTTLTVNAASGVLANDTDVDGPALQAVLVTTTTNGSLTLNADGSFVYTPAADFFGKDTFRYKVSDGSLDSSIVAATITVTNINDVPIANNNTYTVNEDGSQITGNVIANNTGAGVDIDADGNRLYVLKVNNDPNLVGVPINLVSGATLQINRDGSLQYDLNGQFQSLSASQMVNESFTYTIADGWNVRMIQVTGSGINTTAEAEGVLAAATGLGTLSANSEAYNVTFFGDTVATEIDFGSGNHDPGVNDDFDVNNVFPNGIADGGNDFLVSATSSWIVPAGTYTIALGSDDGGYIRLSGGATFSAVFNSTLPAGSNEIRFDTLRAHGTTGGTFTVAQPTQITLDTLAWDHLSYSSFEISIASGAQASFNGAVANGGSFHLLQDGTLGWNLTQSQASVDITVQGANDAPVLNTLSGYTLPPLGDDELDSPGKTVAQILASVAGTPITDVDTAVSQVGIAITGESSPFGSWQYSTNGGGTWTSLPSVSDDSALTLVPTAKLRFVPDYGFSGTASFMWRAWDQTIGSDGQTGVDTTPAGGQTAFSTASALASVVVVADNPQPPQLISDSYNVLANGVLTVTAPGLLANDYDPDAPSPPAATSGATLVYNATKNPNGNPVWVDSTNVAGFDWALTGASRSTNVASLRPGIRASYALDGTGGGTMASITDLPNEQSSNPASFELWLRPTFDVDKDILFETGGSVVGTSLSLEGQTLRFKVSDNGVSKVLTATIDPSDFSQVVGIIDPGLGSLSLYVNGQIVAVAVNTGLHDWADGGGSGLGRVNGSTNISGGTNFEGEIALFRFYESALTSQQVLNNYDSVATGLKVISASSPTGGQLTVSPNGSFVFKPNGAFDSLTATQTGDVNFSYTVQDGSGLTATTTATITVQGVDDPPVTVADSYSVNSGAKLVVDKFATGVLSNDTDPEGHTAQAGTLTATVTTPPTKGTLTLSANGKFVYTSNAGAVGTDEFFYVANDGDKVSQPTRVVITIAVAGAPGGGSTGGGSSTGGDTGSGGGTPDGGGDSGGTGTTTSATSATIKQPTPFGLPVGGGPPPAVVVQSQPESIAAPVEENPSASGEPDTEQSTTLLLHLSDSSTQSSSDSRDRFRALVQEIVGATINSNPLAAGVTQLIGASEFAFIAESSPLWQDLQDLEDLVEHDIRFEAAEVASALGVTTTLSVGYVLWFLRGTYLVSCVLAQMPAWKMVDPLFVFGGGDLLGDEDDESLNAMLQRSNDADHEAEDKAAATEPMSTTQIATGREESL